MAKVNKVVWKDNGRDYDEVPTEVKVGDVVWFKSDHEQRGRITRIEGDRLHLHNPDGFGGDYLRYRTDTVEFASDCWL